MNYAGDGHSECHIKHAFSFLCNPVSMVGKKMWASFLFTDISRHATTVALVDKHAVLSEANQY